MNAKLAACILATPCSMTSFPGYILGGISCRLVVVWWQPILLPGQPALRSGHSQGAPSSILVGPQDPLPEDSSPTSNPRIQAPSYGHTSCPLPVQGAVKGSEPHASSIRSAFNCLSRQIWFIIHHPASNRHIWHVPALLSVRTGLHGLGLHTGTHTKCSCMHQWRN